MNLLTEIREGRMTVRQAALSDPSWFAPWASRGAWRPHRHLRHALDVVHDAIRRGNGRIILNMPPVHGKTRTFGHWLPIWAFECDPTIRMIYCGHTAKLAREGARKIRNEFDDNDLLLAKLSEDSTAADRWSTDQGGGMIAGGVDTAITGFHGNILVLDDPYKDWKDAMSSTYRDNLIDWWQSAFFTRRLPNATVVVIHHRWHPDDLTGWLTTDQAHQGWQVIRFPAFADANDALGRQPGEPLCPMMWSAEALNEVKMSPGMNHQWEALYQQNPQGTATGRVYSQFGEWNLDAGVQLRDDLPLALSFDFNIDPGMHVIIGQHDTMTDHFRVRHEIHGPRLNLRDTMKRLKALLQPNPGKFRWPEVYVYGDVSGNSETHHASESSYDIVADTLREYKWPFRIRVAGSAPAIMDSVQATNDALRDVRDASHVSIHPECVRLVTDLRELQTSEDGKIEKSDRKLSHASDCLRYWVWYIRPVGGTKPRPRGRFGVAAAV